MYDLPTLVNNSLWDEFQFHIKNQCLSIETLQDILRRAKDQLAHLQCLAAKLQSAKPAGVLHQLEMRIANLERLMLKNQCSVLELFITIMSLKLHNMTEECLSLLDSTDQEVTSPIASPGLTPMLFSQVAEQMDQQHLESIATHSLASGSCPPSPVTISTVEEVEAAFAPGGTEQSISPNTTTKKRPKACPKSKKLQQDQEVREVLTDQASAIRRSQRLSGKGDGASTKKVRYKF